MARQSNTVEDWHQNMNHCYHKTHSLILVHWICWREKKGRILKFLSRTHNFHFDLFYNGGQVLWLTHVFLTYIIKVVWIQGLVQTTRDVVTWLAFSWLLWWSVNVFVEFVFTFFIWWYYYHFSQNGGWSDEIFFLLNTF